MIIVRKRRAVMTMEMTTTMIMGRRVMMMIQRKMGEIMTMTMIFRRRSRKVIGVEGSDNDNDNDDDTQDEEESDNGVATEE